MIGIGKRLYRLLGVVSRSVVEDDDLHFREIVPKDRRNSSPYVIRHVVGRDEYGHLGTIRHSGVAKQLRLHNRA
jgi:hypothetical protein